MLFQIQTRNKETGERNLLYQGEITKESGDQLELVTEQSPNFLYAVSPDSSDQPSSTT